MNATRPINATILGLLITLMIGTPAAAQFVWMTVDRPAEVALEVLRPDFTEGMDATLLSSAVFLSGRYPLAEAVDVVTEIPVSHFGADGPVGTDSETALGNPYIGVELGPYEGSTFGELGVRLPVAAESNNGLATGFLSDRDIADEITLQQTARAVGSVALWKVGRVLSLGGGPAFIWGGTAPYDVASEQRSNRQETTFRRLGAVGFVSLGFTMLNRHLYLGLQGQFLYGGRAKVGPFTTEQSLFYPGGTTLEEREVRLDQLMVGPVIALNI